MTGGTRESRGSSGTSGTGGSGSTRVAGPVHATATLAPVRVHLLRTARIEADRIRAAARAQGDALLTQARDNAESAIRQARARGHAETAPITETARSQGRERAQSVVFGAQREAYEELCHRVHAAADSLRGEPGYPVLLARLADTAARVAGPGATISYPPGGGVLARSGQVIVDCSLPRLAEQAVRALGDRVRDLWRT